ncbi:MAG: class I SAM-dependent methyltransferase [Chloroflexi bacterium]|nr:class I SAM-dependent methyltransferase [Chloroflexota bacterium]
MKVVDSCPICKGQQFKRLLTREVSPPGDNPHANLLDIDYVRNYILFEKVLRHREPIEFSFEICTHCGLVFFNPRPEDKDMAIKYAVMDELQGTELRAAQCGPPIYDDKRAREIFANLGHHKELVDLNVVDVGGANGYNLKHFVDQNTCFVVDYGKRDLIDGASYLCQTMSEVPDTISFDVALCCHTLEHMVDPVTEIMNIRRAMSPEGLLYIEVPLGCHDEYKHTGNLMTHINFFSEGSIGHLLSACNMKLRHITTKLTTIRWFRWLSIVAIAQNSPPDRSGSGGYEITMKQMNSPLYGLYKFLGYQVSRLEQSLHRFRIDS